MGAYSTAPILTKELESLVMDMWSSRIEVLTLQHETSPKESRYSTRQPWKRKNLQIEHEVTFNSNLETQVRKIIRYGGLTVSIKNWYKKIQKNIQNKKKNYKPGEVFVQIKLSFCINNLKQLPGNVRTLQLLEDSNATTVGRLGTFCMAQPMAYKPFSTNNCT